MVHFYTAIDESILTCSITVWYTAATARDRLQRIIRSAERVIGCNLPSLHDLYTSRTLRCIGKIKADPSHPGHSLSETLPSGKRLRSIRTKTSRHPYMQALSGACSLDDDMLDGDLGDGMRVRGVHRSSRMKSQSFSGVSESLLPGAERTRCSRRAGEATWIPGLKTNESLQRARWKLQRTGSLVDLSKDELRDRLQEATEVIDMLCCELEVAHRYLEGKYEALKILQGKAILDKATSHTQSVLQKSEEKAKALEKEVNSLQWELSFNQVQMKKCQQSWEHNYNRVLSENQTLTHSLQERQSEIQQLRAENSALSRQCLELLSMLNVKEQRAYQETKPQYSPDRDAGILELAVLGACRCVGVAEVCPCSRTAAASRKQLIQLQQELDAQRLRREEALMVADAFRIAFEQQLRKRSQHFLLAAEANILKSHHCKTEGANRSPLMSVSQRLRGLLPSGLEVKTPDELLETLYRLLDLLNDKEEALAHQRKVSIMLAHSAEELQRQLHLDSHCKLSDPSESRIPSKQSQGPVGNQNQSDTPESKIQVSAESNIQAQSNHKNHKSVIQQSDPSETRIPAPLQTKNQSLLIHKNQVSETQQSDAPEARIPPKSPKGSLCNQSQSETPESTISQDHKNPKSRSPWSSILSRQPRQTNTKSLSNHKSHKSETQQSELSKSRIALKQLQAQLGKQSQLDRLESKIHVSSESDIQAQKNTEQLESQPQPRLPPCLSESRTKPQELSDLTQTIIQSLSNLMNHKCEIQHSNPSDSSIRSKELQGQVGNQYQSHTPDSKIQVSSELNIQAQSNHESETPDSDPPESRIPSKQPKGPLENQSQYQQTSDTQESKIQQQQPQQPESQLQPGQPPRLSESRTKLQDLSDLTQTTIQPLSNHKNHESEILQSDLLESRIPSKQLQGSLDNQDQSDTQECKIQVSLDFNIQEQKKTELQGSLLQPGLLPEFVRVQD
uniref:coiled-coil domain-containing protein 125 n=1 Tax=Semicossyphus pulcher TaxID=241346 RepID=UPI0037E741BB